MTPARQDKQTALLSPIPSLFPDHLPIPLCHFTLGGHLLRANSFFCRLTGHGASELEGLDVAAITHPDDLPACLSHRAALLAGELETYTAQQRYRRKDGSFVWVKVHGALQRARDGSAAHFLLVAEDISALKSTEAELRDSEERYRSLIAQVDAGVFLLDAQCRYLDANPAGAALLGYTQKEIRQLSLMCVLAPSQAHRIAHQLATQAIGEAVPGDWLFRRKDRSFFEAGLVAIRLGDGSIQIVVRDATARAGMLETLQLTTERFKTALKSSPVTVFNQDRDLRYTWIYNPVAGCRPEDVLGRSDSELLGSPENAARVDAIKREAMQTGESQRRTVRLTMEDGEFIYDLTADPLRNVAGDVIGVTCAAVDITEREAVQQNLRESEERHRQLSARLAEADREKNAFLALLGHELRNPLSAIRSASQLMQLEEFQDPRMRWSQEVIERQTRHLTRLIDDLLDVSRIAQNKLELRQEHLLLRDLVQGAVEVTQGIVERNRHTLEISLPETPLMLRGDPMRLVQVMQNLIDNAAKYMPAGGRISLEARREGSEVALSVGDTGIGIPPDEQDNLFHRFYQVNQHFDRAGGGLGLGLTLVRQLVDLHGGSVEVFSEGSGRGSRFTVRLPLDPLVAAEPPPALPPSGADLPPSEAAPSRSVRKRILVADDHLDSLESMQMLLEMLGHEVHVAHDGRQALQAAEQLQPDVALLDIGMPVLDGIETARQIRSSEWGRDMLLIAQTGWGLQEDVHRSYAAGFDAHLTKPINSRALKELLEGRG